MSEEEEGDVSERGITEEDGCWVKNKTVSVCAFVCVRVFVNHKGQQSKNSSETAGPLKGCCAGSVTPCFLQRK